MSSDEVKPMVDSKHFWDAAVLITMFAGSMYLLGFTYWVSFFKYFGIDKQFIDLDFEQMISTTWVLGFVYIVAILILIGLDILDIKKTEDYSYSIKNIIVFLFFIFGFLISIYSYLNYHSALKVSIILFVTLFTLLYLGKRIVGKHMCFFEKRIGIGKFLYKKSNQFIIVIIIIISLLFVYSAFGIYSAEIRANDQNGARIILETSGGWQSPKDAILITHMNNKYFIYNFSSNNSTHEVYIIEDSQATKVTLIKDNKRKYNLT